MTTRTPQKKAAAPARAKTTAVKATAAKPTPAKAAAAKPAAPRKPAAAKSATVAKKPAAVKKVRAKLAPVAAKPVAAKPTVVAKVAAKVIAPAIKALAPALKKKTVHAPKPAKKSEIKIKKIKQVRDSFTMPETEYDVIGQVKKACLKAGFEIKKSDLLRIGILQIKSLDVPKLKTLLAALTPLKVGRPKK
ncbi:hypothetical protein [Herbaspirillum autotrophicum]|uniref:hypothetical protein n=1 Tax=Herbaspirillum autotrophicum TaxID=180195 RepID=UPI00067AC10E|nr:hypothetical protein [Herbaspirillum autotrophicum]